MEVVALDDAWRERILADVDALSDAALRTLAVAYRPLEPGEEAAADESLERDLIFVGTVGIIDPPREEAAVAIREAHRAGIRVVMITGDHPRTAARIAADLGIVEAGATALTGLELDALDDAAFAEAVRTTSVYARVAPAHKLRIVDALQADGHIVAMTGDGVNDAPALKSADIGVAMGVTGTEVTKQAAKMILADDNFATIVEAVREGRGIFDNIRKFLRYLLSSNMGEVLTVFLGVVLAGVIGLTGSGEAVVLPLLATQILWINLITDSGPALAMGVDPQTDDVMARKPRRLTERVIDARMWAGVIEIGAVMAVVTLLTIDLYLPGGLIEGTQRSRQRAHRRLHRAGLRPAVQLLQRPLGEHQRLPAPVRQPLAVGRDRVVGAAAGGGGQPRLPQRRLRHGAADLGPVARLRGDGQRGAVGQRAAQVAAACAGRSRMIARGDKVTGVMVNGTCTRPNATLNGRNHA